MNLLEKWRNLLDSQTEETFNVFWEEYSDAEKKIYSDILNNKKDSIKGNFSDLAKEYNVSNELFMGFLDGINSSLKDELVLENIDENSDISLDIVFEDLYFNMHLADAPHLYGLDAWLNVYDEEKLFEIEKAFKKSKTFVKEISIGRNDPCSCGSGKKYKKCCGK